MLEYIGVPVKIQSLSEDVGVDQFIIHNIEIVNVSRKFIKFIYIYISLSN